MNIQSMEDICQRNMENNNKTSNKIITKTNMIHFSDDN